MVERDKTVLLTTHYLEEADAGRRPTLADRVAVINRGEIIAEGRPAEIKAKTSGKRIRCIARLGLTSLRQIPGVVEVREDREAVEIHSGEAESVVRELLLGSWSNVSSNTVAHRSGGHVQRRYRCRIKPLRRYSEKLSLRSHQHDGSRKSSGSRANGPRQRMAVAFFVSRIGDGTFR